jgi:signal transduction histidine kinase
MRETGLPVEYHIDGDVCELPVGVELSAYRIVQEGLTNALKHAGAAPASVAIRYSRSSLEIEVAAAGNGRPAAAASPAQTLTDKTVGALINSRA